jgi:hypothetical protein
VSNCIRRACDRTSPDTQGQTGSIRESGDAARNSATKAARAARVELKQRTTIFRNLDMSTLRRESLHRTLQCEGSSRLRYVLQVAVGTHWSEDTLGFPPEESRLLRLDATQQQRSLSRELPSIYLFSVLLGKCVACKQEYFRDAAGWWMLSVVQDGLRVFAIRSARFHEVA